MSNGVIILSIFAGIILIPLLTVITIWKVTSILRKRKACKCTSQTSGMVISIRSRGSDSPTVLTVSYQVGQQSFQISETLKLKSQAIKAGAIPIGQRKVPVMGSVTTGDEVTVCYNPGNPSQAIVKENEGWLNC